MGSEAEYFGGVRRCVEVRARRHGFSEYHVVECASEFLVVLVKAQALVVGPGDPFSPTRLLRRWPPFERTIELRRAVAIHVRRYERQYRVGLFYEGISLCAFEERETGATGGPALAAAASSPSLETQILDR